MNFKVYRKKAGYTLEAAGRELGISKMAISSWETGKTVPRSTRLIDIANLYGCTVEDLIGKEKEHELNERGMRQDSCNPV